MSEENIYKIANAIRDYIDEVIDQHNDVSHDTLYCDPEYLEKRRKRSLALLKESLRDVFIGDNK